MKLYPLMANLEGCPILIVGGGVVATRKARALIGTGARLRIVSPEFSHDLLTLAENHAIQMEKRSFNPGDLNDCALVFAATDDRILNDDISDRAMARGTPVNNITNPEKCTFFVPSQVSRGSLTLAISTSGKSPATAKWLRKRLEREIGPEYETLIDWMGTLREALEAHGAVPKQISRISETLLEGGILDKLRKRDTEGIRHALEQAFHTVMGTPAPQNLMARLVGT